MRGREEEKNGEPMKRNKAMRRGGNLKKAEV
jgi:hypothetical protein